MVQNAIRDENQVNATLGSPMRLKADHTTGYMKVKFVRGTLAIPSATRTTSPRDDNNITSVSGSYNGVPKQLMADHDTGCLKVIIS